MDCDLRNCLWNAVLYTIKKMPSNSEYEYRGHADRMRIQIWTKFLKMPCDAMYGITEDSNKFWHIVRQWYFNTSRLWYETYEFLEALWLYLPDQVLKSHCANCLNTELSDEKAAYSFFAGNFVPMTNSMELSEIEKSANLEGLNMQTVAAHIKAAIRCFSAKPTPDYANSMKESISAVEAICKFISGMEDATLHPALENTVSKLGIHLEVSAAIKGIYKYTNDESGIRHARKNNTELQQEDARFLLVTCSSFVNLVAEKARRLGLIPK